MKKIISKEDIRKELDSLTQDYLNQGGEVDEIPRGVSGRENADAPLKINREFFGEPKESRTYVPEVIAAIEERRQQAKKNTPEKKRKRPRKKMVYDDFGEPVRWIWVDE